MAQLIGIDIGTSAIKGALVDERGDMLALARKSYELSRPQEGWAEQDAEEWWRGAIEVVRDLTSQVTSPDVAGLGFSCQGETLVPIDEQGRPLYKGISWVDQRARSETDYLSNRYGPEFWYQKTGRFPWPGVPACKLLWLRNHRPDLFNAHKFLHVGDYLAYKMTGNFYTDESMASRSNLFNTAEKQWDEELLDIVGISGDQLPQICHAQDVVGYLSVDAARALGLPAGTPVVMGGHDQTCAAVGAGIVHDGDFLLSCGTAWVFLTSSSQLVLEPRSGLDVYCHVLRDRWAFMGVLSNGGAPLQWFKDYFCECEVQQAIEWGKDVYDLLIERADVERVPGDSQVLILPHFMGSQTPAWDHGATGVIIGLTYHHRREDIVRAILEAVVLESCWALSAFPQVGIEVGSVRMIGGAAKSRAWAQMVADATGAKVYLPVVSEAACRGAAILAGLGTGIIKYLESVAAKLELQTVLEPRPEKFDLYKERFKLYREAYEAILPISQSLARR